MNNHLNICVYILISIVCISCNKVKEVVPYQPTNNLVNLIAGDSIKKWKLAKRYNGKTRMNMGDCFLNYRQSFYADGSVSDNNKSGLDCGPSLEGQWNLRRDSAGFTYVRIHSDQLPVLLGTVENYKDFRVFYASEDSLHLSFIHNQYGKKRRISDYLVSEKLHVKNRNFHH